MLYVYVLQNKKDGSMYVGKTSNLRKRVGEHNRGLNSSTKTKAPWKLVYYEAGLNEKDMSRREKYFKSTQGGRLLKRRIKEYIYEQKNLTD